MSSASRICLAFDITPLAASYSSPAAKRGITRVVENVLQGLVLEPSVDLVLTAVYAVRAARQMQASEPAFAAHPLRTSRYPEAVGSINHQLQALADNGLAGKQFLQRSLRFGLRKIVETLRYQEARISPAVLADRDIFHSLYDAFPGTLLRCPTLRRFLTVYDLIPLQDPTLAKHASRLRRAMRSVQPNDWLLCISQSVKNDVCDYLKHDPDRVFVTPLAASQALFYPCKDAAQIESVRGRGGIPAGKNYILSLSALDRRKNLRHLIRCFLRLSAAGEIPDLCLVLVGQENSRDVAELLEEVALDPSSRSKIIFTGYVADVDLAALYSGATMFAFPSLAEGFGLPPLEAMQCGVPVICSNTTSLPEVVGDAGLLLEPQDADGWCESILRLAGSESLRAEFSARGIERARQFSWERCVAQTVAAYRTSLAA